MIFQIMLTFKFDSYVITLSLFLSLKYYVVRYGKICNIFVIFIMNIANILGYCCLSFLLFLSLFVNHIHCFPCENTNSSKRVKALYNGYW